MFHTQGSTAFRLLEMINAGGATADAIMAFFAPICNCDPGAWIKTKLQEEDETITAIIQALIARPVVDEPLTASVNPWAGWFISSSCSAGVTTGVFADGSGNTYTAVIPMSPAGC